MTLVRVISEHWHAVERDLLSLGLHADDIGTAKLSCWEFISIVVASPPNSAVFHADKRWSQSDELMANLGEQQAGVLNLNGRYARPGVDPAKQPSSIGGGYQVGGMSVRLDALPVVDFKAKLAAAQASARAAAESGDMSAEKQFSATNESQVSLGGDKIQVTDLLTGQVVGDGT